MRKVVRVLLPVACAAAALSLLPAASASAATITGSCTRQVLLLPGMSTSCSTDVVACPTPTSGLNSCFFSARTVAGAAVGIAVGGKAVSNATAKVVTPTGQAGSVSSSVSATCSAGLAILGGCAGQTDNKHDAAQQNAFAGTSSAGFTFSSGAQATCQWTGGPIAALVTLTCTEEVDYSAL